MTDRKRLLCTICARGGSKSVPGKNIRLLGGNPLIQHSVDQAKETGLFDVIAVSSDDPEILAAADTEDKIARPLHMATDEAAKIPAIHHALSEMEERYGRFDVLVDLDATSPLRLAADIKGAVDLLLDKRCSNVITGALSHRSPYFNLVEEQPGGNVALAKQLPNAVVRRQDMPRTYDMNASIYVWDTNSFRQDPKLFYPDTMLYEMPPDRSLDIDSETDFEIVTYFFNKRKN
jgi:N-acylneuraminate cytidylyltransferase/CMP-N,N'-diacetyllegionaminic acid synthase